MMMVKMQSVVALLVLLVCLPEAQLQLQSSVDEDQSESQRTEAASAAPLQLDVSAEVKQLREMVLNLGAGVVELSITKTELTEMKKENAAMEARLETRLKESEDTVVDLRGELAIAKTEVQFTKNQLEELKRENAVQAEDLTAIGTRLADMKNRLTTSEGEVGNLKTENAAQAEDLAAMESDVENLKTENAEKPKVAFSAAWTHVGYVGPFNVNTDLVYSKVITNVGKAYSHITGVFKAPVRGVYYFRFTAASILSSYYMGIHMYKNGERLMALFKYNNDGQWSHFSSGATVQLEVGDVVYMRLPASCRLYDDSHNHNIFSGFLLFPM